MRTIGISSKCKRQATAACPEAGSVVAFTVLSNFLSVAVRGANRMLKMIRTLTRSAGSFPLGRAGPVSATGTIEKPNSHAVSLSHIRQRRVVPGRSLRQCGDRPAPADLYVSVPDRPPPGFAAVAVLQDDFHDACRNHRSRPRAGAPRLGQHQRHLRQRPPREGTRGPGRRRPGAIRQSALPRPHAIDRRQSAYGARERLRSGLGPGALRQADVGTRGDALSAADRRFARPQDGGLRSPRPQPAVRAGDAQGHVRRGAAVEPGGGTEHDAALGRGAGHAGRWSALAALVPQHASPRVGRAEARPVAGALARELAGPGADAGDSRSRP